MRIGFLGLGRMGTPIATALADGNELLAFDPDPGRSAEAGADVGDTAADGIRIVATLPGAVHHADVLITVLPGAEEFADCLDGIVEGLNPGALWIDCTTNDPRLAERAASVSRARGASFVGAAMTGGPEEARAGTLHLALSGEPEAVERAIRVLAPVASGDALTVVGEQPGDADTVKLLSNLLWFGQVVAVTEAMLLGTRLGVPEERLLALLAAGPGSSVLLNRDYPAVLDGDYRADFGIDRIVEELDVLTALADDTGVPFGLSRLVADVHRQTLERFGRIDGELLAAAYLREKQQREAGV